MMSMDLQRRKKNFRPRQSKMHVYNQTRTKEQQIFKDVEVKEQAIVKQQIPINNQGHQLHKYQSYYSQSLSIAAQNNKQVKKIHIITQRTSILAQMEIKPNRRIIITNEIQTNSKRVNLEIACYFLGLNLQNIHRIKDVRIVDVLEFHYGPRIQFAILEIQLNTTGQNQRVQSSETHKVVKAMIAYNFDRLEYLVRAQKTHGKIQAALTYSLNFDIRNFIAMTRQQLRRYPKLNQQKMIQDSMVIKSKQNCAIFN